MLLNASNLSKCSISNSWKGLMIVLSKSKLAVLISSALLPKPVLSLMPKSIGETTL